MDFQLMLSHSLDLRPQLKATNPMNDSSLK